MFSKIRRFYPPLLDGLTFAIMFGMISYVLFHYGGLPDEIPTHFNMAGEADSWGNKGTIFALIFVNAHVIMIFFALNYFLIIKSEDTTDSLTFINIPFVKKDELTTEQIFIVKRHTARMFSVMNLMIAILFATIYYEIIQTAHGNTASTSSSFGIMLVLVMAPLFYYIWKIYRDMKLMNES